MPTLDPGNQKRRRPALLLGALIIALAAAAGVYWLVGPGKEDEFIRLMNTGKNYYDQGQCQKAMVQFRKAVD